MRFTEYCSLMILQGMRRVDKQRGKGSQRHTRIQNESGASTCCDMLRSLCMRRWLSAEVLLVLAGAGADMRKLCRCRRM